MRIVVTGGLGHIGSRLVRDIPTLFPGAETIILDNLLTQRFCSLFNLPREGQYRFVEADIRTYDLESAFAGADVVVHLAAITDAANSFDNSAEVESTNFNSTERVARACAKTGAKMIFLSTTSVYGTQNDEVDENCTIDELKPQSPYAESKLKAEQMLAALGKSEGLSFVTLRFGTIFGISVGMRFHTAVNKFVWQACLGKPITVWRTALDQKRPYLDLSDGIQAFRFIIENGLFDNDIYNVVTVNATVREIVDTIRVRVPDLQVELVDARIMNQLSYNVSRRKFEGKGFVFSGDLVQGINDTIETLSGVRTL